MVNYTSIYALRRFVGIYVCAASYHLRRSTEHLPQVAAVDYTSEESSSSSLASSSSISSSSISSSSSSAGGPQRHSPHFGQIGSPHSLQTITSLSLPFHLEPTAAPFLLRVDKMDCMHRETREALGPAD